MKSPVALLVLLPLLALPGLASADDHTAREVQDRFGVPQSRLVVSCGGEQAGVPVHCLRWQYDSGTDHAVLYFDAGTGRLLESFTWDDIHREATITSDQVRTLLHAARDASEP